MESRHGGIACKTADLLLPGLGAAGSSRLAQRRMADLSASMPPRSRPPSPVPPVHLTKSRRPRKVRVKAYPKLASRAITRAVVAHHQPSSPPCQLSAVDSRRTLSRRRKRRSSTRRRGSRRTSSRRRQSRRLVDCRRPELRRLSVETARRVREANGGRQSRTPATDGEAAVSTYLLLQSVLVTIAEELSEFAKPCAPLPCEKRGEWPLSLPASRVPLAGCIPVTSKRASGQARRLPLRDQVVSDVRLLLFFPSSTTARHALAPLETVRWLVETALYSLATPATPLLDSIDSSRPPFAG